jgi:hypothetical protein
LWLGASARRIPGHAGAAHKYSYWVNPSVAGQIVRSAHARTRTRMHARARAQVRIQLRDRGILSLAEVGVFPPQ